MTRKKGLRAFSKDELLQELARRHAEELYRDDMTMTDMELAVEQLKGDSGDQGIEAMLRRMKPEKPTGKACPKCGKRTPVKVRDRERTVRSLAGPVTFKRNYHYCEECKYGFYPVDRLLNLPEEGELTSEMEMVGASAAPSFSTSAHERPERIGERAHFLCLRCGWRYRPPDEVPGGHWAAHLNTQT